MRKVKFAFLFVLILCLAAAMFVACNPDTGSSGTPAIPTPDPGDPGASQDFTTVSGSDAWDMLIDAAKASNSDTGQFVFSDTVIYLDYVKDTAGYAYALKVQSDLDLENDAGNQMLVELWRCDENGELDEVLVGLYYYDSMLVYDCTGLRAGATVVKTDDINVTAVIRTLRELLSAPGSEEYTSLAQFLLDEILSSEGNIISAIAGFLPGLFGSSRLTTNADGTQTLVMPIALSDILGGVLGGLLAPGEGSLIPQDVYDMINNLLGIDLALLSTMKNLSVYLSADLTADNGSGRELAGVEFGIGFDYDTFGSSLEEIYGAQQGGIDISIGGSGIQFNNDRHTPTIESYLTAEKPAGRGLDLDNLDDYSLLTVDLTLSLELVLNELDLTPNELIAAFGGLFQLDPDDAEALAFLLDKEIDIAGLARTLQIHISGGIDMFDNAGTNLLVEITGSDKYEDVRISVGYVGADETLYADLSGLLGTGKFYVDGINLNEMLGGLFDDLVVMVQDALAGVLSPEEQEQADELERQALEAIADGRVLRTVGTTAEGEPILDTMGLVKAILDNIDVEMAGNIFNLEKVQVRLTQDILDYIWSIAFVDASGNYTGATIPIDGDVVLELTDNGFASSKDITLNVALAVGMDDFKETFASAKVGISARFGSVENETYFNDRIAAFSEGKQNKEYIRLSSLDAFINEKGELSFADLDIEMLLANVESLELGLKADIDLSAIEGSVASINYEKGSEFLVSVLAEFAESFSTSATLSLRAEVTDVSGLIGTLTSMGENAEIGDVLPSLLSSLNVYIELAEKGVEGTAPLRVWLVDGVVYLATSEDLLGGLNVMVDIKPFLPAAGASEAISAEDTTGQDQTGTGTEVTEPEHTHVDSDGDRICDECKEKIPLNIPPVLVALVAAADITLGDLYLDVVLGTDLIVTLLELLDMPGLTITDPSGENVPGLDLGVSINFGNGLQIADTDDSEGLFLGIVLGVGDNFDLDLTLGGINAVINGESNIVPPTDEIEFVDFFNEPYVTLDLTLGINADIKSTDISISDTGKITFPDDMTVGLELRLQGKLDLAPLLAPFTGTPADSVNRTELAISIVNTADGAKEVLLAAYYKNGILYVDASALIGARVSVELDIMELLVGLITACDHVDKDGNGICDNCNEPMPVQESGEGQGALTATEDGDDKDYSTGAFDLLLKVTSKGFVLELAEGLTELIMSDSIGANFGEIDAALSLNWSNLVDQAAADGTATEEYLFSVNVSASKLGSVGVTLSPLAIGIGETAFGAAGDIVTEDIVNGDYKNLGSLIDAEGKLNVSGLALDSVYAELSGTISLSAKASDSETQWTIGSWISNFLPAQGETGALKPELESLIEKLVVSFVVEKSVGAELTFDLSALLRFPEVLTGDEVVPYILSHSDIALEIKESGNVIIALYIVADTETGRSDLYIYSPDGGIIGGGVIVPGIDLGSLLASDEDDNKDQNTEQTPDENDPEALVATGSDETVCTEHVDKFGADGKDGADGICDNCGAKMEETDILGGILSIINGIYMTDSDLRVNFGANFLSSLLGMLLGYDIAPENFVQLDPSDSFLAVFYGKNEGEAQRDIGIELSIAANPVVIGLSLGGIAVAINDPAKDGSIEAAANEINPNGYTNIFASDGVVSLNTTIDLELALFDTEALPDGELPVGDILSNFIANLALGMGVSIDDDLRLAAEIVVGANIHFGSADATEAMLVIRDKYAQDNIILAAYLRGSRLYVDMGMLSDHDFYIDNTGIVQFLLDKVSELLLDEQGAKDSSEAVTATEDEEEDALEMLEIVLEAGKGHIALSVTEAVLLGILGAVLPKTDSNVDINEVFEALGLDAEVEVDISFDPVSVNIGADTNYAALSLSIVEPSITNKDNVEVKAAIDKVAADPNYQSYVPDVTSKARFGIELSVEYTADATYEKLTEEELQYTDAEDRYELRPDGTYVQNGDGEYVRRALSLSEIVDALLSMPAISDGIAGIENATLSTILNALLRALGVELYLDDPIGDNLLIRISGLLDLEKIGLSALLGSFTKPEPDMLTVLEALEAGIELVFNPEDGDDSASVAIYLIAGDIYLDLSGLGGPRIKADLFGILEKMEVTPFYTPEDPDGADALIAEDQCDHIDLTGDKDENGNDIPDGKCDNCGMPYASDTVNSVLNALIRAVAIRRYLGSALEDGSYDILQSGLGLDVMLTSNLLGNVVALITGNEEGYVFEDFVLNENDSKISLNIGGDGALALVVSARSNAGFNISVSAKAGLEIDIATRNATMLTDGEKRTFVDMTAMAVNVIDLINGDTTDFSGIGSQQVTISVAGRASFESDGEGSYDVGSLLAQYLEDIALNIETNEAFGDSVAFRLTVAADLGKLNLAALADETATTDEKLDNFLNGTDAAGNTITDLSSIEVALELLETDYDGNVTDEVLAGIYISGGMLYLDGTGIFDVVENYSYVPNFLRFVLEAIELGGGEGGNGGNGGEEGGETTAALSAAENDTAAMRDALLQLVYSDTSMQILITKGVISTLLATLVPDLGSITDIFDAFEVSLGADIGRYNYVSVTEAAFTAVPNSESGAFVAIKNVKGGIVGFEPYAEGIEGDRYDLDPATKDDLAKELYYLAKDDNYYLANRYSYHKQADFADAEGLAGTHVLAGGNYIERAGRVFYVLTDGRYVPVDSLAAVGTDKDAYVYVGSNYVKVEKNEDGTVKTFNRRLGYVRDPEGDLLRVYYPYTELNEFYLALGAHVGTMNVGLAIGGIDLEFGMSDSIVPDYVTAGKTKTPTEFVEGEKNYTYDEATGTYTLAETDGGEAIYYQDFPLMPFYNSVITVGAAVEIELAITEGNIDIGQIFSAILGDLEGIVIQIPETNKGYSSAHLRLDLTLVLDMFNVPGSELMIELYNLSSETGAEVRWLAAYYMNDMLYIDLSFFGLPKLSVPMTEISEMLDDTLGDLLNGSIYQDVEVSGSEAIIADDETSASSKDAADLSLDEKVAALLISKRKLAVSVGNALMRYLLTMLTIGDDPLNMLIYEQLQGGLDVTIDLNNGFDVGVGAELMLEGDRYEHTDITAQEGTERYFVFIERNGEARPEEGLFIHDEADDSFREASKAAESETTDLWVRHEAAYTVESGWVYYTYTAYTPGESAETPAELWYFDEATDSYKPASADDSVPKKYTRVSNAVGSLGVYVFVPGAGANPNDYDTELTLDLGVGDIDMYFTEQRDFTLDAEELDEFYEFNSLDTVSLSETISLGLLFDNSGDVDLGALLEYLFPDSEYDFDAILDAESGKLADEDILRDLNVTVSLEFKLGAFINYLRSLAAQYDLSYEDGEGRTPLDSLTGDIDLITFINVIRSLIGAKKVPNAEGSIYYVDANVDDLLGLEDFLNFVNASVEISTVSNDGVPEHTMLGVYFTLGDNEGTEWSADNDDIAGMQRYSHYFASEDGTYGYVGIAEDNDGEKDGYMPISEIDDYNAATHGRYTRDVSFLYPDENGNRVREFAGLYVDLSYLGQPGVYLNLTEMLEFIGKQMGEELAIDFSEAVTAAGDDEGSGSSFSLPYDLGTLFGDDVSLSDSLPLLSEEIAAYIRAFVFGARITSTYIRVMLQTDFVDQLLLLLTGDFTLGEEFEQSYLGINVDVNNYLYKSLDEATTEQIEFSDTRFAITPAEDGMYWLNGEIYELRSDMTAAQVEEYEGKYYNITPIDVYLNVGGEKKLASEASNTDWVRAERYTDAGDLGNGALIGTYKFYVYVGEGSTDKGYAAEEGDTDGDGYAELATGGSIYVVYPAEEKKPFIEANIWLWGHNLSLNIDLPETAGAEYVYYAQEGGSYVLDPENDGVAYDPANSMIANDGSYYLYYRGHYYQITQGSVLKYENGTYNDITTDSDWKTFLNDPYTGEYYLKVTAEGEGFKVNVAIAEKDVYKRTVYRTAYKYVGKGNGNFERQETTSLVTVPEFRADFDHATTYTPGSDDTEYYVSKDGTLVTEKPDGYTGAVYKRDDFTFVHSASTGKFTSVSAARELYGGEDGGFADYLKSNYDTDEEGKVLYYNGSYINYGDTGELYYISLAVRGSISLSQHVTYIEADSWNEETMGAYTGDIYALVRGEYVKYDESVHGDLKQYYAVKADSAEVGEVLGAILGSMDALFKVGDGYNAVLPFEIRATVKIAYPSEDNWTPYIAGLELAIDLWRTESGVNTETTADDGALTHVLGLYYMSDKLNIDNNNIEDDRTEGAALYADLSWILGPTAKVKVDLSAYTLEDLLNDKVMSGLFGEDEGGSEAVTAAEGVDVGDPDTATVLLSVFSRKIALQASAGFLKLVLGMIAPDISATLDEMMPNISVGVDISAAPYDLTVGATLHDSEGNGLLDLGLTLNLFGTDDPTTGLQIGFGALADYEEVSAANLAAKVNDYIYYHSMFSRADGEEVLAAEEGTYYKPTTGKEYEEISLSDAQDIVEKGGTVYKLDDGTRYIALSDSVARAGVDADERYMAIPGGTQRTGYIQLRDADDYAWATDNNLTLYYYQYAAATHKGQFASAGSGLSSVRNSEPFISYGEGIGQADGTARAYVLISAAKNAVGTDGIKEQFGDYGTSVLAADTYYMPEGNGTYMKSEVFGNYQTLLGLDLGTLLNAETKEVEGHTTHTYGEDHICTVCGAVDILGVVVGGLQSSGLSTIELGGTLKLDLTLSDALNWTRQMSELMAVSGSDDNYFSMLIASMALNSAEFVSAIGLEIDLALQINASGLIGMLPELLGGGEVNAMEILPVILRGAKVYMEIAINTNFFGEKITGAEPIKLWVEISDTEDLFLNIYLIAEDLGTVTGLTGEYGDFFAQGIKIENMISLSELLLNAQAAEAESGASIAADGGIIIDIGNNTTGLLSEDIWGVLDLILGQVLFAHDMISVGITENIIAELIRAAVPEFKDDQLDLLPTFTMTGGSDTSGVNLLFGNGALSLQVQLGVRGGFDDYVAYDELVKALDGKSSNAALNGMLADEHVYGIENEEDLKKFIGTMRVTASKDDDGNTIYTQGGNDVIISTPEYAIAAYVSPEKVWLGTRYTLNGIDADGNPVFKKVEGDPYATAFSKAEDGEDGKYVKVAESIEYYISATEVGNYQGKYMLYSDYLKLIGKGTPDPATTGTRYTIDASKVVGEYVSLGDVTIAIELGDLGITVNRPFSAENEDIYGFTSLIPSGKAGEKTSGIRLSTEIEVGFWGNAGAGINMGELVDLIFGLDAVKKLLGGVNLVGSDLAINITGDLGSDEKAYFTVLLDAYFDFTGELQAELQVMRNSMTGGSATKLLGVILADDGIYIDLSGVLGPTVKAKISSLGIKELLSGALGGLFGTTAQGSDSAATIASVSDTADMTLHSYAYLAAMINPGYFSLQLTLAAVEAILAKVSADNPDVAIDIDLPDLGDIRIESFGNSADGSMLSLGFKMSEDFGVSIDVTRVNIGTAKLYTSDYITKTLEKEYKPIFDVATGEISDDFTLSATADISVSMTSEGLSPDDGEKYDNSLAGWVIGLLTDMLGGTGFFVSAYDPSDAEYNAYSGPIYTKGTDDAGATVYTEAGKVAADGSGYYAKTADGYATTVTGFDSNVQYYRTTMIEATFASGAIDLGIELEADINLGAIIASGIGGILFSDLRVAVTLGAPFDTTILEVYYLGSSRLVNDGNVYGLRAGSGITGNVKAFSDAIYIDASGLGLGKIKFQGIAGLLGANVGFAYEQQTIASGAISAAEGDETGGEAQAGETVSVALGIDLAENYIGINIYKALIDTVFGMLGDTLAESGISSLPDVQEIVLGLSFGEATINSITLDAVLDSAGTGATVSIGDIQLALENSLDVEDLVGRVRTQFAGLTYSKTAGTMTLLTNILDGLKANLALSVDKRGVSGVQATSGTNWNWVWTNRKSSVTLKGTNKFTSYGQDGAQGFMLVLNAVGKHPEMQASNNRQVSLDMQFGNGSLCIDNVDVGNTAGDVAGVITNAIMGALNGMDVGSLLNLGSLLGGLAYSDADNGMWDYTNPMATAASDGADAAAAAEIDESIIPADSHGSATYSYSDMTQPWSDGNKSSHYDRQYGTALSLEGLVNKVEVNLFNKNGYQPYLSTMKDTSTLAQSATDASLISIKVEFTKDGYNELMIYLYTMLLGLIQESADTNSTVSFGVGSDNGESEANMSRHGNAGQYQVSNLFRELDAIDNNDTLTQHQKTVKKSSLMSYYAKSLPYALGIWLLESGDVVDLSSIAGGILEALIWVAYQIVGNITALVGSILPPFANYDSAAPNPSLNLYIDLDPQESMYGIDREIAPGIQAVELMVNAEKAGGGRTLSGVNYAGSSIPGEIWYDPGESDPDNTNWGGSYDSGLHEAYVLAINPRNLLDGGNNNENAGEGLLEFAEALNLNGGALKTNSIGGTTYNVNQLQIVVTDPATRAAKLQVNNGSGGVTDITTTNKHLTANFLLEFLPRTASVNLVDPACTHNVTIIWDASALDFSPAALDANNRLAGYVYGYALNLVVAAIPVYVTGDQAFNGVYEVSNGGKGDPVNVGWETDATLPEELVYIGLGNNGGYVFGTQRTDAEGNPLTAVLRQGSTVYMLKTTTTTNADGNVTGVTASYEFCDINVQDSTTTADNVTTTVTYTVALYPAYTAYTEEMATVTVRGTSYIVLRDDAGDIDDPLDLPKGTFSWDLNGLDYGWDGTHGGEKVTVTINYQWGFSATQSEEITLSIPSKLIDGNGVTFTGGEPRFENWSDLVTKVGTFGGNESLEGTLGALADYFEGLGDISGIYVDGDAFSGLTVADWDLTALKEALTRRAGRETSVDVTMYVTGFSVWREFGYTDIGNELEFVRGFGDDFFIQVDGVWDIPDAEQAFALLVNNINNRGMLRDVAQPVTVTVTIGEEGDFDWASPAAPGGDGGEETAPDTYSFSDGSATALNGGVQTYEITTAAQLYGAMPESGSVVHSDGTTKRAAFDWNGFAYDTERSYNVARLSVTSGGDRIDTDVVVTLADNADVNGAAGDIGSAPENSTAGIITKIVDPRYRAMAIDPLAYGTLGAFLEGTGRVDGSVEVVTEAGDTVTMTVVSWSDKLTLDAALPLAGVRYSDNIATFKDAEGNLWQAVVPVIVNERVIVGTELLFPAGYAKVSEARRFSETVRRYVYENGGQVIEVSYSRETFMPTGITVMNPYAYKLAEVFPGGNARIEITFADGMVKAFDFSVEGITAPASGSDALTLEALKWSVAYSAGAGSAIGGTLDFMYSGLSAKAGNMISDIAYGDLDGTYQVFAPYENMKKNGEALTPLWRVDNTAVGSSVTVHIDGRFVPVDDPSYTEIADGMDAPAYQLLKGHTYDKDGNYVSEGGGTYVYVYAASYTFKGDQLTWDCSGMAYNYSGGVRRATVNVEVAGLKGTMQMPVYIESGRVASLSFTPDEQGSYAAYFESGNTDGINYFNDNWNGSALSFDPFNAVGKMYDIDAEFTTHTETDGSVVIDSYLYFPVKADVNTVNGAVIEDVTITWSNLGAIRNSYGGGKFDARITLPAVTEGEGDKAETIIPAQGYTLREFVIVQDRSFADDATLSGIDALPATGRVGAGEQTYIDPLTFDLSVWQKDVEAIESVSIGIKGKENPVTFTKGGAGGYTLTWVYTGMGVNYLGGKVSLVARLTGPDGYAQDYSIDYLVSRVVVSGLQEYDKIANGGSGAVVSGGKSYTFDTDVESANFGLAVKDGALDYYVIDPYKPDTFKMPNAWMVTYTKSTPVLEDGSITGWNPGGTEQIANTYLTAAMPMVENITYEVARDGDPDAGEATLRLGNGQRVRIKVSITKRPYDTSTGTPEFSITTDSAGKWLPTKTSGINIVWYGRVFIGNIYYIVTLSNPSGDKVLVPEISGRNGVTYILTPYVGAVVNATGKVLDWSATGRLPGMANNTNSTDGGKIAYDQLAEDVSGTGRRVPAGISGTTLVVKV